MWFPSLLLAVPAALGLLPQSPSYRVRVLPPGSAPPRIDGRLDDAAWRSVPALQALTQVEPLAGAQPTERTEIRITHDERAVYVAIRCFDSEPEALRATQRKRDADLDPDDRVELLFDTYLDRRNAYWFQIGAAGSRGDALITKNGSSFNKQWDGIWKGRARIDEFGWSAELAIPAATINFDSGADVWGFNVRRFIRRRNEEARWASPEPRIRFFSAADAGTLTGMRGLRQGLGLDVKPFGVVGTGWDATAADSDLTGDAGLDIFYRITPSAKLSLSVNTDFAETEVDNRVVNLTRFPLFFPEKRDFFLEDSGHFFFGPSGGFRRRADVIPFFSRRIGIDEEGAEVPLLVATKLTGQTDEYSWGLLEVRTDDRKDLDGRDLFAGRVAMNLFEQSDVGVLWTHGNPTGDVGSDTVGIDLNLRTSRFRGNRNLRFSAYALQVEEEGTGGLDNAWHASLSYPNDEVDWSLSYTTIEDDFDPALGFVPRSGIRKYAATFNYRPRMHTDIRRLRFGLRPTWITGIGGRTQTATLEIEPFGIEWESGDEISFFVTPTHENLDTEDGETEDFEIHEGVVIPEDEYDFVRYGVRIETSDKRDVSGELRLSSGSFFGGDRTDYTAVLDWRIGPVAQIGFEYELNDFALDQGAFAVNVARLRTNVQFNTDLSWSSFLQWDDDSDEIGLNSRLWVIFEPGREAFLVLNQGWERQRGAIVPRAGDLTLKVGYTLRF